MDDFALFNSDFFDSVDDISLTYPDYTDVSIQDFFDDVPLMYRGGIDNISLTHPDYTDVSIQDFFGNVPIMYHSDNRNDMPITCTKHTTKVSKSNINTKRLSTLRCCHNRYTHACIDCTPTLKCPHNKRKYNCLTCTPTLVCKHGKKKYNCPICYKRNRREHVSQRLT
jgi:hypothetical protein